MIGKDALIKAIRIASGGGGVTPPDPLDLRLHWDVDDSDLEFATYPLDSVVASNVEVKIPEYVDSVVASNVEVKMPEYVDIVLASNVEVIGGSKIP